MRQITIVSPVAQFRDLEHGNSKHASRAGLASKFEQTRRARIFGVQTVTKSRHAFAPFTHSRERARSGFIHRNRFAHGAIGNCFEFPGAIFNGAAVMTIDRHDPGRD